MNTLSMGIHIRLFFFMACLWSSTESFSQIKFTDGKEVWDSNIKESNI